MQSCLLPFDIFETIIDVLAEENDTHSLKATSLVCHFVLPLCRKYLFPSIQINKDPFESPKRLLTLFSPQSNIHEYIRKLNYRLGFDDLGPSIDPTLLERISFLQSLTLWYSRANCAYIKFRWIKLDPSMELALLNLMHLPTLTHLHLNHINHFPISYLSPCTNLEHLQLEDVVIVGAVSCLSSCARLRHLQLEKVRIADYADSLCTLAPSEIFTVPRILEYTVGGTTTATTTRLLRAKLVDGRQALDFTVLRRLSVIGSNIVATQGLLKHFEQLEEVQIKISGDEDNSMRGLATMVFHATKTITTLSLVFRTFKKVVLDDIFFGLCDVLAAMAVSNVLKTLRLKIDVASHLKISSSNEWKKLDVVLSSPGWSCLEHVFFDITVWNFVGINIEQELKLLTDLPNTHLIHLSSRTSLDFKFSTQMVSDN